MRIPVRQSLAITGALAMVFSLSDPIVGAGGTLIKDQIQSSNFVSGASGWRIQRNGNAEFNNVTIRGKVIGGTVPGPHYEINGSDAPHGIAFYTGHANESFPGVIQPDSSVAEATIDIDGPILDGGVNPSITLGTNRFASNGQTRVDMNANNATWAFTEMVLGSQGTQAALAISNGGATKYSQLRGEQVVFRQGSTNNGVYLHTVNGKAILSLFTNNVDEAWTAATFNGTWTNFGAAGTSDVQFRKMPDGLVVVTGSFKDTGAQANPVFTLPVGYRPGQLMEFACKSNNDAASISWIQINSAGQVNVVGNVAQARVRCGLPSITFYSEN